MRFTALLLFWVSTLLVGCSKDFEPSAQSVEEQALASGKLIHSHEGASAGMLAIKLHPESCAKLNLHTTRSGQTRSGVGSIDLALQNIGATKFKRLLNDKAYEEELRKAGLDLWYKVEFDSQSDLKEAAIELAKSEDIAAVEFMHKAKQPRVMRNKKSQETATRANTDILINDPHYYKQWNLRCGDHVSNKGWVWSKDSDINIIEAWDICTGDESIVVAVLDEPVQSNHPDLEANIWVNPNEEESRYLHGANFCTKLDEPIALDWSYRKGFSEYPSHGTHVAGSIAAVNGNSTGICGIAGGRDGVGGVKIMSCQIFYNRDEVEEAISNAFIWAANRGALIAQCSFGYDHTLSEAQWMRNYGYEVEAIDYFINHPREGLPIDGGLVIFAAGNDGNSIYRGEQLKDFRYAPGCYPETIAVAATTPSMTPACFTSYGSWIDISAPGGDSDYENDELGIDGTIFSTVLTVDGSYEYMEGTSMACPQVSGVAALGLSYAAKLGKSYTTDQFRDMLLSSTNPIDQYFVGSRMTRGYNYGKFTFDNVEIFHEDYKNKMGGGLVDAFKMLMFVEGTPIATVGLNEKYKIDASLIFGGAAKCDEATIGISNIEDAERELGLSLIVEGGTLYIRCTKCGTQKIRLTANIGETRVERELAVVVRESAPQNGGWL